MALREAGAGNDMLSPVAKASPETPESAWDAVDLTQLDPDARSLVLRECRCLSVGLAGEVCTALIGPNSTLRASLSLFLQACAFLGARFKSLQADGHRGSAGHSW